MIENTVFVIFGLCVGFVGYLLTMSQFNRVFLGYADSTRTIVKHEGWFVPKSIKGGFLRKRKTIGTIMIILGFVIAIMSYLI